MRVRKCQNEKVKVFTLGGVKTLKNGQISYIEKQSVEVVLQLYS